jgi:hypothetical protein
MIKHTKPKRKVTTVCFDDDTFRLLKSLSDRYGQSASMVICQALKKLAVESEMDELFYQFKHLFQQLKMELNTFNDHRLPELNTALKEISWQLLEVKKALEDLTQWLRVIAFWSALSAELFKARLFQCKALSNEEYETFKKLWEKAHELADRRISTLTGETVWNRKFDPISQK